MRRPLDAASRWAESPRINKHRLTGVVVFAVIAALIVLLAVTHNFYAWGILGASLVLLVVVVAILWYRDTGQVQRFEDTEKRA